MSENTQRRREPGQVSVAAESESSSTPTVEQAFAAFLVLAAFVARRAPSVDALLTAAKVVEAFAEAELTVRVVEDAMRSGALPSSKAGRKSVARRSDVEAWLTSRRVTPHTRKAKVAPLDAAAAYAAMAGAR